MWKQVALIEKLLQEYSPAGINPAELTANARLNPLLRDYVPFCNQKQVLDFFQSEDRLFALQSWVNSLLTWGQSYVRQMVELVCTPQYRKRYTALGQLT